MRGFLSGKTGAVGEVGSPCKTGEIHHRSDPGIAQMSICARPPQVLRTRADPDRSRRATGATTRITVGCRIFRASRDARPSAEWRDPSLAVCGRRPRVQAVLQARDCPGRATRPGGDRAGPGASRAPPCRGRRAKPPGPSLRRPRSRWRTRRRFGRRGAQDRRARPGKSDRTECPAANSRGRAASRALQRGGQRWRWGGSPSTTPAATATSRESAWIRSRRKRMVPGSIRSSASQNST